MKVSKPLKPDWAAQKAHRSLFPQQQPPEAQAAMQTDAPIRKTSGRLSREDQRRLGDILQRVYDDVIRQGVPDRFRHLLTELEHQSDGEQARSQGSASGSASPLQCGPEHNSESDNVIEAKGSANPSIKGSH